MPNDDGLSTRCAAPLRYSQSSGETSYREPVFRVDPAEIAAWNAEQEACRIAYAKRLRRLGFEARPPDTT